MQRAYDTVDMDFQNTFCLHRGSYWLSVLINRYPCFRIALILIFVNITSDAQIV